MSPCGGVLPFSVSTHSITYSVEIKQISGAVKGISRSPCLARPSAPSPHSAVFGFTPEGQGVFMHHDGSVVLQKEEICTSCLGDVGFLHRRADSSDLIQGDSLLERVLCVWWTEGNGRFQNKNKPWRWRCRDVLQAREGLAFENL